MLWYERIIDYNIQDQRQGMFAFLRTLARAERATESGLGRLNSLWEGRGGSVFSGRRLIGMLFIAGAAGIFLFVFVLRQRKKSTAIAKARGARRSNLAELKPYFDLMKELEEKHPRRPSQTPLDFAAHVREATGGLLAPLEPLTRGYYEVRYNGGTWSAEMDRLIEQVRQAMNQSPAKHKEV